MYAEALARKRVRLAKKCHERFLANSHSKWPTELKDQIGLQAYHTLVGILQTKCVDPADPCIVFTSSLTTTLSR